MIGVILQARMGSSRLPGKVLKTLYDDTVLGHVIRRVEQAKLKDTIIIATTNNDSDDAIVSEAKRLNVDCFRGSEDDVLSRYYYAAKEYNLDTIVRITSDCPLIDPRIIDDCTESFLKNSYDIVSNAGSDPSSRTFPRGLDVEIFDFDQLEKAFIYAAEQYQREHVTPYIYETANNVFYFKSTIDYSKFRWTLDTDDDLKLISSIYNGLYKGDHNFYMEDIIKYLNNNPELIDLNSHVEQKKLK